MIDEQSLVDSLNTTLHVIRFALAIARWAPWVELIGTALIAAAIGYCAYPLASAFRMGSFRLRRRAAPNPIEAVVATYNTQFAFAPLRRGIGMLSFVAAIAFHSAFSWVFAALGVLSALSLSYFRRPVDLWRDPPFRFLPDRLVRRLQVSCAVDDETSTALADDKVAAGGVRTMVLQLHSRRLDRQRAETGRLACAGYRTPTAHAREESGSAGVPAPSRQEQVDEIVVTRACLGVLDKAILLARVLVGHSGFRRRGGIDRARAAQLYDLLDAIHNIPAAVEAPASSYVIQSGLLRRSLEAYDARWGRGSSQPWADGRISLLAIYEAALSAPAPEMPPMAALEEPPTGYTLRIPVELRHWAIAAAAGVNAALTGKRRSANIFVSAPSDRREYATLKLWIKDELSNHYAICFTALGAHDFHPKAPAVPDLVEALHMVAFVLSYAGAEVGAGYLGGFERTALVEKSAEPVQPAATDDRIQKLA